MNEILFYSWDKLTKKCDGNIVCILKSFEELLANPMIKDWSGTSFILDLKSLLDSHTTDVEKIEYLYLTSLRNYFDFKYQKDAGLYLYFSDIALERLKKNKLLKIENEHIKFKYEEQHGN